MTDDLRLDLSYDNYCVIGNPVTHSKSPRIHQAFADQTNQNIRYQAFLVNVDGLIPFLETFQQQGGKGLNVTLPFKEEACQAMQVTTARASRSGSVNTVWFAGDGSRLGDTTDGRGLAQDLFNNKINLQNKHILILGAGGAVRGILPDLFESGPAEVTIVNRTYNRAEQLQRHFSEYSNLHVLPAEELGGSRFDLVINGTSASLKGEMLPLPDSILAPAAACYDMAYADTDTVFIRWAKQHGAAIAVDGLGMLVEQAAEAFKIWRGVRPNTAPVIAMLRKK
ncbi:MAG: Shikimate dehydrogenase ((+)) [Gammaproteobacteria bacterium]|nr:Shikimate dehydrogenase ((+)) [Gammaproteobacteria bacterium]